MGFLWTSCKLAIFALIVTWAVQTINFLGFGRHGHTHWPGPCKQVQGVTLGSEDGEVIDGDLALLTSGLCYQNKKLPSCADYQGKMLLFDFNQPDRGAKQVKIIWENKEKARDFHPHGMSIWWGQKETTVMVVNHEPDFTDAIELFTYDKEAKTLTHKESIILEGNFMYNDVKATGPRSFYFTVPMKFVLNPVLFHFELYLRLPLGWIGHYDGEADEMQVVASGMFIPNGIQMSPDGGYVYVSNSGEYGVDVFQRHSNNSLNFFKRVALNTVIDNLSLDEKNSALWVGGVPVPWRCQHYLDDPRYVSPSQILKLELKDGVPTGHVREVYYGNGEAVNGVASVGLYHKSRLFIGSVHDRAAVCDILYI